MRGNLTKYEKGRQRMKTKRDRRQENEKETVCERTICQSLLQSYLKAEFEE